MQPDIITRIYNENVGKIHDPLNIDRQRPGQVAWQCPRGCDAAYYLIHGMKGSPRSFAALGRRAAENFREAADRASLRRIVYVGGLGSDDEDLSEHLASRHEVRRILASGSTPVVEIRAAVIIGSGSISFKMIRHLAEVLPVIMKPRWVGTRCQPIAVRNVLKILIAVLGDPDPTDRIYDIGGPDILTYEEMMQVYAEVAGLRREPSCRVGTHFAPIDSRTRRRGRWL